MRRHQEAGFTLIELMVAVVILGILASIALPSYQSYLRRSACEDTKGVLAGAAGRLERFKAQNNTYTGATLGEYEKAPVDGSKKHADITVSIPSANSYTLTATGAGVLSGKGTLTLDSAGVRGGNGALADAWDSCGGI